MVIAVATAKIMHESISKKCVGLNRNPRGSFLYLIEPSFKKYNTYRFQGMKLEFCARPLQCVPEMGVEDCTDEIHGKWDHQDSCRELLLVDSVTDFEQSSY